MQIVYKGVDKARPARNAVNLRNKYLVIPKGGRNLRKPEVRFSKIFRAMLSTFTFTCSVAQNDKIVSINP